MKQKDQSIETLRGFAILLVVAGYIITQDITRASHTGMAASALRFFYYLFTPIRMPLFTVISAYLYAATPATQEGFRRLVQGKASRIFVPFLVVSTIQYIVFSLLPMQNHPPLQDLYRVYIWPHEQLWFLYSIFEIFILIGVMDALNLLNTPLKWSVWLTLSLASSLLITPPHAFSLFGVNYLMPFFLMGYGIRRFSKQLFLKKAIIAYGTVAFFSGLLWVALFLKPFLPEKAHHMVGLLVSFSAVPLLIYFRPENGVLARIGYFAFGIHILNRMVVSGLRAVFENNHLHNTIVQFTAYVVCGVLISIIIQQFLEKFTLTRRLVLGLKGPATEQGEIIWKFTNREAWGSE